MRTVRVSVGGTYHFREEELTEIFRTFRGMFLERFPEIEVRQEALVMSYGEQRRASEERGERHAAVIVQAPASILFYLLRTNGGESMSREMSRAAVLARTDFRLIFVPSGED